jgi:hypothetical protein
VAVGEPSAFVEMAAGERAQPVEMRLDVAKQRFGEMQAQQIRQRRIGPVEIHPRGVRGEQSRLVRMSCPAILLAWLHGCCRFRPLLDVIDHLPITPAIKPSTTIIKGAPRG